MSVVCAFCESDAVDTECMGVLYKTTDPVCCGNTEPEADELHFNAIVRLLHLGTFRYFLDATFRSGRVGQHVTTLLEGTPA